jgi:hypothetical protein
LNPATKRNIKAFIYWCRHKYRINEVPEDEPFPLHNITEIIRNAKTHKAYIDKSKTISDTATPSQFTDKVKWIDWLPTFKNFLRAIPGRNGVPLVYIIRDDPPVIPVAYTDFIDEYIDKAPLEGTAFITDASEVHTYLVKFISENDTAESKVQMNANQNNGRIDFLALQEHYEGVGVNALDVTRADRLLETLFYSGEKKPHMWWGQFERLLNEAFTIYDRKEGRIVHSEHMKLRILCKKVTADFLNTARSAIQLELAKDPITITYKSALTSFRNQVNLKFPPELSASNNRNRMRRINETNSQHHNGGRGRGGRGFHRGRGGGRFHGRQNGRGRGRGRDTSGRHNGYKRSHRDARMVQCTDGSQMEVHASYRLTDDQWHILPEAEKTRILTERANYKRSRGYNNNPDDRSTISQLTTITGGDDIRSISESVNNLQRQISNLQSQPSRNNNNADDTNNGPPGSIMGGRNEQASLRSRNRN